MSSMENPNYAPVTDDGRQNLITDLFDKMEKAGANTLGLVGNFKPTYRVNGVEMRIPGVDDISLGELKEDLLALDIVHNTYVYDYTYKPLHGSIESMVFMVNTYEIPGIFSIILSLKEKTYK